MSAEMEFTPELAREFQAMYKQAVADGAESFMFYGHEVLTAYAKYMCEFLAMRGSLEE